MSASMSYLIASNSSFAIYVQTLLSFVPALWAFWDLEVSDYELEADPTAKEVRTPGVRTSYTMGISLKPDK